MKKIHTYTIFLTILLFSACFEKKFGDIDPFVGEWDASMRIEKFDELGNKISDSLASNLGTIKIIADPDEVSFNAFTFPNTVMGFSPLNFLVSVGADLGTNTNGERVVYISPDIDNERAKFWGVSTFYGSVADLAMITKMKKNEIEFTSAITRPLAGDSTKTTLVEVQHLILKK